MATGCRHVPVRSTHTSYVVAGHGNAIHAIGAAEAFRALKATFRCSDGALCCLITYGYVPVAATG
jgi:hypothetical protein